MAPATPMRTQMSSFDGALPTTAPVDVHTCGSTEMSLLREQAHTHQDEHTHAGEADMHDASSDAGCLLVAPHRGMSRSPRGDGTGSPAGAAGVTLLDWGQV